MGEARTIMVVAGGEWQLPLIAKAGEMGLRVINTNLYEDSPGFELADVGVAADVLDYERNLEIAREFRPDAVITDQSDIAVPTVAYLCEQLALPGIGVDAAERFTNKLVMRECCSAAGFPCPPFRACQDIGDLRAFFQELKAPIVVKPPANQSSRGVSLVRTEQELDGALDEARSFSGDGSVLAEQFVGGTELTVEGLKLPGRHVTLAISTKTHYDHHPLVANRLLYTWSHPEIDFSALEKQHDGFIEAMRLPFGLTHTEYKFDRGDFYLIEAAARGGGTKVSSHIAPLMSGVDANSAFIRMALGDDPGTVCVTSHQNCAVLEFFEFDQGTVAAVDGLDRVRAIPGVIDAGLTFGPGDTLAPSRDDRSRHMHLIVTAPTPGRAEDRVRAARDAIVVTYA